MGVVGSVIHWPWVSRLAYDLVVEQNSKMLDELLKIRRREAGMPEQPRPSPRLEAQGPIDIPDEVEDLISGLQSESLRNGLREQYRIRIANGATPERLYSELSRQLDEPEEGEV